MRVTEVDTGAPAVGVEVLISRPRYPSFDDTVEMPAPPTDENGDTSILTIATPTNADSIVLTLMLTRDRESESIDVQNQELTTAAGERFRVEVLTTDAPTPPVPVPQPVLGSEPVEIRVDGYVRWVGVCDHDENRVVWAIGSGGGYVGTVPIGTVPISFEDRTFRERDGERRTCSLDIEQAGRAGSFTVYLVPPDSNERTIGGTYCLDAEGRAQECASTN